MGVCPKCGLAFEFTRADLERPLWFGGALYLEGRCDWCAVRTIVPAERAFALEEPETADPDPSEPATRPAPRTD